MRKLLSIFALAFVALASQAYEVTLFDGTDTSDKSPFYYYYFDYTPYTHQVIYPEDAITALEGSSISSMTFYFANDEGNTMNGGKVTVSIGTTETNYFNYYGTGWATGEMTKVAEFSMTHGDSVIVVNFDQPWFYPGGNILLETKFEEDGTISAPCSFYGQETNAYFSAYGQATISTVQFIPKTTFVYEPKTDYVVVTPQALDFGQVQQGTEASKVITITNYGTNPVTPVFGALAAPYSIQTNAVELAHGESMQVTVTYVPGEIGQYPATLTIDCGAAGNFEIALTGETIARIYAVTVGDQSTTNEYLPIYTYYFDAVGTLGQMIYKEEMMGAVKGNKITKVTFYPTQPLSSSLANGKVKLSFKNVGETVEYTEAVAITELTAVANYTVVGGETELVFVLDEPYQYDGGSLAVEAQLEESTSFAHTSFYGTTQGTWRGFYHYPTNYSPVDKNTDFLPMTTFTYDLASDPQPAYDLGDVNHDHAVNVADVTDLIKYILTSGSEPVEFYIEQANVDGIDQINVADVTALIQKILQN